MKTTKRYLFPLIALLALTGCKDDDTADDPGREGFRIAASIDAPEGMNTWQAQDEIKVVCADELYTFTTTEGGASAQFTDRSHRLSAQVIGSNAVSAYSNCTSMWGTFRIQAEQLANDGVNTARVPMFAYTMNNPEQNRLKMSFRPLASVLELEVLPYDITVTQLSITPAEDATISGGAMAGNFTVNAAHSTVAINNAINSIKVDFNGGLNLAQGATLRIPMGWFAVEGGLTLTFRYGTKDYTATIWADDGIVKTFADNAGYKSARFMQEVFEFDANSFPRPYYVKTGAPAASKGLSWDAPTALASAIRNAVSGSTIHIAAGTYQPADILTGGSETDGYKCFEITQNVTLIGGYPAKGGGNPDPSVNKTILDGGGTSFHTLVISSPKITGEKVLLKGLIVSGGKNSADNSGSVELNGCKLPDNYAAGVAVVGTRAEFSNCTITDNNGNNATGLYAMESDLTINSCSINTNNASGNGGGAWITSNTQLTLTDSHIDQNTAALAAGLYLYLPAGAALDATVSGTSISGNAASGNTGGLYIRDDSGTSSLRASFSDCEMSGNSGAMGGGIQILNAKATFTGCRLTANTASGNGVIYLNTTSGADAYTLLDKCTVSGNRTTGSAVASGLYVYNNGGKIDLSITNSTFTDNITSGRGGAIYARNNQAGNVNVTCVNSTFLGNQSGSFGSAIAMYGAASKAVNLTLISSTLTGNTSTSTTATGCVGMETAGLSLKSCNSIISGNMAGTAPGDVFVKSGITATIAHQQSIIGTKYYTSAGAEQASNPAFSAATMLSPLADNGGATRTSKLVGSASTNPAFGNGKTATELKAMATADISADVLGTDQTGASRGDTERIIGACVKK